MKRLFTILVVCSLLLVSINSAVLFSQAEASDGSMTLSQMRDAVSTEVHQNLFDAVNDSHDIDFKD